MYFLAHNLIFVSLIPNLRLFCLIEEVKQTFNHKIFIFFQLIAVIKPFFLILHFNEIQYKMQTLR